MQNVKIVNVAQNAKEFGKNICKDSFCEISFGPFNGTPRNHAFWSVSIESRIVRFDIAAQCVQDYKALTYSSFAVIKMHCYGVYRTFALLHSICTNMLIHLSSVMACSNL